jgi:hypothetical protein
MYGDSYSDRGAARKGAVTSRSSTWQRRVRARRIMSSNYIGRLLRDSRSHSDPCILMLLSALITRIRILLRGSRVIRLENPAFEPAGSSPEPFLALSASSSFLLVPPEPFSAMLGKTHPGVQHRALLRVDPPSSQRSTGFPHSVARISKTPSGITLALQSRHCSPWA